MTSSRGFSMSKRQSSNNANGFGQIAFVATDYNERKSH